MSEPNWDRIEAELQALPDDASDEQLAEATESLRDEVDDSAWRSVWHELAVLLRHKTRQH